MKKGLIAALALAGMTMTAQAATPIDRTVGHVKRLERHNKFHLRHRIGGPFKLSATSCGEPNGDTAPADGPAKCRWDATAVYNTDGTTAFGNRMRCTIEIRLRETKAHHVRWKRVVIACAEQMWRAP